MSLCVGLTGGIASGKSTVAQHFAELEVPLIDADQVARDVVAKGSAGLAAVCAQFGPSCLDESGELNRRKLREIVFADDAKRAELEAILHPLIKQALGEWRQQLDAPYGILMAPIMTQGGFDAFTDRILVVDVSREVQKQRLILRDDINETLAEQMLNAQASREQRLSIADELIDNSTTPAALIPQVTALHEKYLAMAGH